MEFLWAPHLGAPTVTPQSGLSTVAESISADHVSFLGEYRVGRDHRRDAEV